MLSILIPIYNQDVRKLVSTLALQCQKCGIHYQILCFDDASKERFKKINRQIESVYGVSYIEFGQNMGRSRIRNKLGFNAMYDHMLFLDCDSKITAKRYIKNYINVLKGSEVIYGGTIYSKRAPKSVQKKLHWLYGNTRERLPLKSRLKSPYLSFRSNNFIIHRDIFLAHKFDEEIEGYGHEDTLFAQDLKKSGIHVMHIQNPVQHGGLEKTDIFLSKVQESVENLVRLRHAGKQIETSLTDLHSKLSAWSMMWLPLWIWRTFDTQIMKNLNGSKPSIYLLDLYKLKIYHSYLDKLKRANS